MQPQPNPYSNPLILSSHKPRFKTSTPISNLLYPIYVQHILDSRQTLKSQVLHKTIRW